MLQEASDNDNRGTTRDMLRGFTLVEALVAVTILTAAMTPLFAQVQASFRVSRTINENLTGAMLAQEGIELVRAIRDDNWFNGNPYDQELDSCGGGCHLQYDEVVLRSGPGPAFLLDGLGRYQYTSGNETIFTRTLTVTTESDGTTDFLKVVSAVSWDVGGNTRTVTAEDYLFDWLNP